MKIKTCTKCHIPKALSDFNGNGTQCRNCMTTYKRLWRAQNPGYDRSRDHLSGAHQPLDEAKNSPLFLGVYVAERVLSRYFDNITRMPMHNPGYDFICGKGFKIDCKSACLRPVRKVWQFAINHNTTADYFLCLAFDDRKNLDPKHIWLIPGAYVSHLVMISVLDTPKSIAQWAQYEKPLDKVIACCATLRSST